MRVTSEQGAVIGWWT